MRPIVRDAALVVSGVLLSGIISWLREVRRRRLANAVPTKVIQVVGDIYLDMIAKVDELPHWDGDTDINQPIETTAGGSALNTAVQLSTLCTTRRAAHRCELHSLIGEDLYGDLVKRMLDDAGVTRRGPSVGGQGVCICLSGKSDRAFVSYKGSVARLSERDLELDKLFASGTAHVHFAAYYDCCGLQPSLPALLARARDHGATTSIVTQSDQTGRWTQVLDLLPLVDVFIGNELEVCAIAEALGRRERPSVRTGGRATPSEQEPTADETWTAMGALLEAGAPLVVTTRGPHGAMAAAATGERWTQETIATTVVDTTGAGDAFAAGFLFGWVGGGGQDGAAAAQSDRVCLGLSYGCAAGAAAVGQMGGSSPLPAEKVDSAMVLKPVTVEKRRAKTEPTRRHTVATPVRMGSARW
jgi:sugar/nucleoside kinase (ribokinase family)